MTGVLGFVWSYWLLASIVGGGLLVQWFTLWVPGTGWRGVVRTLVALWLFALIGIPALAWFERSAPDGVQRAFCVVVLVVISAAVVWLQPGEVDGRGERPPTAPGKG